jgi:hypothetical protein
VHGTRVAAPLGGAVRRFWYVALEQENDQQDDQDQQENATTDVHLNLLGRR